MTDVEFQRACSMRLETLYKKWETTDNLEPIVAFRKAPERLQSEVRAAINMFNETWDSDWK